eukprot:TRINITY_DN19092_c1_g2_i1.p3 TRINITY_DN19092_c1_g2~~TRINITY_DN19092_c1_g2_i1.p3  ORF type:complete len:236 (+),score=28.44 TRINITY_DN19092_c1_g2_i1:101-709(+)
MKLSINKVVVNKQTNFRSYSRCSKFSLKRQGKKQLQFRPVCVAEAAKGVYSTYNELEKITCDLSAFPDCEFFNIQAIIRPWREESVIEDLVKLGVRGLTVMQVRGIGSQRGGMERYAGTELGMYNLVDKLKLEVVCLRQQVDEVVRQIASSSYTGEHGDGKIFISPIAEIIRIRTAETGKEAEKMAGGMEDLIESVTDTIPE